MDAWIDCMTSLDAAQDGMTSVRGSAADSVVLRLDNVDAMPKELFDTLVKATAIVNWCRLEFGEPAILVLAFNRSR